MVAILKLSTEEETKQIEDWNNSFTTRDHLRAQWHNNWGRGAEYPLMLFTGKFLMTAGKRETRKKWKIKKKRRKLVTGKVENLKWKGGKYRNEQRTLIRASYFYFILIYFLLFLFFYFLFFIHFFFFFCLSLFETNEICLGSTKIGISTGKKQVTLGKNIGKSDFALPQPKTYSSYATAFAHIQ